MASALIAGIANGGIYGLLAFGLVLIYRDRRVVNLAHAEIGTLSVLAATLMGVGMWPWGAIASVAIGSSIAIMFERVVVSRMEASPRSSVTVATIGLSLLLIGIELKFMHSAASISSPIGGLGPKVLGYYIAPTRLIALGLVVAFDLGLLVFTKRTRLGMAATAASQDRIAAGIVGIPAAAISAITWGASGAIAAASSLLAAPLFGLGPGSGTTLLVRGMAAAIIGGIDRPFGPLMGGLAVGVIDSVSGHLFVQSGFPGISTVLLMMTIVILSLTRARTMTEKAAA